MAFSPDFEIMVTGSDDQRVRVFNAQEGTLVCKLKGHTGYLFFVINQVTDRIFCANKNGHSLSYQL